jgi:hypothetical protein
MMVQIVDKISLWPLKREKTLLEVEKLRTEVPPRFHREILPRRDPYLDSPEFRLPLESLEHNRLKPFELQVMAASDRKPIGKRKE